MKIIKLSLNYLIIGCSIVVVYLLLLLYFVNKAFINQEIIFNSLVINVALFFTGVILVSISYKLFEEKLGFIFLIWLTLKLIFIFLILKPYLEKLIDTKQEFFIAFFVPYIIFEILLVKFSSVLLNRKK